LIPYLNAFVDMVHPRYGYLVHYPVAGGYYEQPYRELEIFTIMLKVFRDYIKELEKVK